MRNQLRFTLITGASEGFGRFLAFESARRGRNLVLVSLPGESLDALASFISKNFSVEVYAFEYDLTQPANCDKLYEDVINANISIEALINNAGIGGTHLFNEKESAFYKKVIQLNVMATTILTYNFIPLLAQQPSAHILNVSSLAGILSIPKKQVYGGTKSYILNFSRSLSKELRRKNITVSTICPGGMNTNLPQIINNRQMSGISRWSVMEPSDVARIAIDGMLAGKELIIPGVWNQIFLWMNRLFPPVVKNYLMEKQFSLDNNDTEPLRASAA